MRCITSDQFKEQPEEIQKVLLDWWEPGPWDLVYSEKYREGMIKPGDIKRMDERTLEILKERNIPLFTLQQLWEFIEDKGYQIGVNNFLEKELYIVKIFESMMQFEPNIEIGDKDKLQAFWKCACEVARVIK